MSQHLGGRVRLLIAVVVVGVFLLAGSYAARNHDNNTVLAPGLSDPPR